MYARRFRRSAEMTAAARTGLSDLQFTGSYRVPFQYSPYVRKHLPIGSFVQSAGGVTIEDIDGNVFFDLTGSYGVNVFGVDFYKECIDEAVDRARRWVRCWAPITRAWSTMSSSCAACRVLTRFRFICRAPKR